MQSQERKIQAPQPNLETKAFWDAAAEGRGGAFATRFGFGAATSFFDGGLGGSEPAICAEAVAPVAVARRSPARAATRARWNARVPGDRAAWVGSNSIVMGLSPSLRGRSNGGAVTAITHVRSQRTQPRALASAGVAG